MKTRQKEIEKVFWSKISRGQSYECWLWLASQGNNEYGNFWDGSRLVGAHRFAWELSRKCKVPKGMYILHMCDNRACCNPDHLYCGDAEQNAKDRVERQPKVVNIPKEKIFRQKVNRYRFIPNLIIDNKERVERKEAFQRVIVDYCIQITNNP